LGEGLFSFLGVSSFLGGVSTFIDFFFFGLGGGGGDGVVGSGSGFFFDKSITS
jgi:hypothetical protein